MFLVAGEERRIWRWRRRGERAENDRAEIGVFKGAVPLRKHLPLSRSLPENHGK